MTVSKLVCELLSYLDSSNNYSLKQKRLLSHVKADERTRTVNLLITNQLLCQLSHIGIFTYYHCTFSCTSGTYRARTCDPLLVRQMLSQLS